LNRGKEDKPGNKVLYVNVTLGILLRKYIPRVFCAGVLLRVPCGRESFILLVNLHTGATAIPGQTSKFTVYSVHTRYLIVGLGNPGKKFDSSRHNIGFKVVDNFVAERQAAFKERFDSHCAGAWIAGPLNLLCRTSSWG
jgi:hypothetical protein